MKLCNVKSHQQKTTSLSSKDAVIHGNAVLLLVYSLAHGGQCDLQAVTSGQEEVYVVGDHQG